MKRISLIVLTLSIIGIALAFFWGYEKYFKKDGPALLYFKVESGTIEETVKARGEVVNEKDFDLQFPFLGTVNKVFVKEGQFVKQGAPLMQLDTSEYTLEIQQLRDQLQQAEAELAIRRSEAANAQSTLETMTAKQNTLVSGAYSTLLSEGLSAEAAESNYAITPPDITGRYTGTEGIYRFTVGRKSITGTDYYLHIFGLETISKTLVNKTGPTPLGTRGLFVNFPEDQLEQYVDKIWEVNIPNTKSALYATNLNAYLEALREEQRAIQEARAELVNKGDAPSIGDAKILQAEAAINSYRSQIALINDKIDKTTLYAPTDTQISKLWLEKGELARPEQTALTLSTIGFKIQTDISELEIAKINDRGGNTVTVRLDAFPGKELVGKVLSIEPKEIVKDGDKYYRTDISIEPTSLPIRSGMSADLLIHISTKTNVLKIPELSITKRENRSFVTLVNGDIQKEVEIKTGVSDGESIEILSGLTEGATITVSAD
jgi:multidrug efflux pump subunit AcrA (membrane-fusion protein)